MLEVFQIIKKRRYIPFEKQMTGFRHKRKIILQETNKQELVYRMHCRKTVSIVEVNAKTISGEAYMKSGTKY